MPGIYAHHHFGIRTYRQLSPELKSAIRKEKKLFEVGLMGPDLLFYHMPVKKNDVMKYGYDMHDWKGRGFFEHAFEVIKNLKPEERSGHLAYIYGFLCHFAIDSQCHPYIEDKIAESGVGHIEIETEFDRMLMTMDGRDPVKHNMVGHIPTDDRTAEVIADFFDVASKKQIKNALKGVKIISWGFLAPSKLKRNFIFGALKVAGQYDSMKGMVVNLVPNPKCEDSNRILFEKYKASTDLAKRLVEKFKASVDMGQFQDDTLYDRTFGVE